MMWRNGLIVLVLSAVSMSAQGVCDVQLSEPTVDFGPLYPGRAGAEWRSPARVVQLAVACEPGQRPGFHVQGVPAGQGWAFGQGSLQASLGEAMLDGQPVTLLPQGLRSGGTTGPGVSLVPGQAWVTDRPGRVLRVQVVIDARLPWQAWQARDRYETQGALLIRAL